ncbi:MAG: 23S rRNA (adenine(2503)-C(2))-methyltransferase RlmN [Fibromonadaceae bacterium]|jgi:23S rRNA (adenine2503-C2)-methyltransferase|nr:23S rRNA (adenine(2503)-C(2))-methyltransferase RlmN [Fibromonadaceae bacterium]
MNFKDIKSLSREELRQFLSDNAHKPYRADQIRVWIFKLMMQTWEGLNVPVELCKLLEDNFSIKSLKEEMRMESTDGTIKWLYKTADNLPVETVMIPTETRASVCVSTQSGCAMNCAFCRTGHMGLNRSLEAGEILEQIINVHKYFLQEEQNRTVTNVIFMGMGEPLMNLDAVHRACVCLHDQKAFAMGKGRLTISTSGVAPKIAELLDRNTPCHLAVSLVAADNETRESLMPVNKSWNLTELLKAIDNYLERSKEWVTLEYILIKDKTCTKAAAENLIKIVKPRRCKVNAIVLNSNENPELQAPSEQEVNEFLELVRAKSVQINIRNPRGRDILAACGQLANNTLNNKEAI